MTKQERNERFQLYRRLMNTLGEIPESTDQMENDELRSYVEKIEKETRGYHHKD